MAATHVQLIRQESAETDGKLSAIRYYHVEVEPGDDSEVARLADGIPRRGDLLKLGSAARAKSIRSRNLDSDQLTYEVQVSYSVPDSETQPEPTGNPLDDPPEYTWGGSVSTEAFFRDLSEQPEDYDTATHGPWTGKPVVNSAGDPPEQLPERQVTVGTLGITMKVATYSDWIAENYKNTVNENAITIRGTTYPPGALLLNNITATGPHTATYTDDEGEPQTVVYFVVSLDLTKHVGGFDLRLEDRGFNELSSGKPKPILDRANQPVAKPYPSTARAKRNPTPTTRPPSCGSSATSPRTGSISASTNPHNPRPPEFGPGTTLGIPPEHPMVDINSPNQDAVRRIRNAVHKVETTPADLTGLNNPGSPRPQTFFARIEGDTATFSAHRPYSWTRVILTPYGAGDDPDGLSGELSAHNLNPVPVPRDTVVELTFAGFYESSEGESIPQYVFRYEGGGGQQPLGPHDHRDNYNGGFAFSVYHPGTAIPQMPWSI